MVSEEDEFSWLRFICVIILGLIVFLTFAEVLAVLFFGLAAMDSFFHLTDFIYAIFVYYQLVILLIAFLSILAIKIRHTTYFYILFVVVVCLCFVLYDMLA